LIEALIDWAKNTGLIRKINLWVHQDNVQAIKLYKKLGFKEEGRISREYYHDGQFYDNVFMGLAI
jgi:RimJ/RimL family protein N-acetyltransferase